MRYITEDNTIFEDESEAITYESYYQDYSDKLLSFLDDVIPEAMTTEQKTDFKRYLFTTFENSEFNFKQ